MTALSSGPDTTMTDALLILEHLDTFYGPVQVHFDVNFEVGRGQIVSLLGGNASGKSTTMKLISADAARAASCASTATT